MGSSQTVLPLVGDDGRIADPAQRVALIGEFLPAISVCGLIDHELPPPAARRATALRLISYRCKQLYPDTMKRGSRMREPILHT
jgi:hypothetical protein